MGQISSVKKGSSNRDLRRTQSRHDIDMAPMPGGSPMGSPSWLLQGQDMNQQRTSSLEEMVVSFDNRKIQHTVRYHFSLTKNPHQDLFRRF